MTNDDIPADKPKSGRDRKGRFKKGQSGNRRGRPPGSYNMKTDVNESMKGKVVIRLNGKKTSIRAQQAIIMRLSEKALQGDIRALNKIVDTVIKLNPPVSSDVENLKGHVLSAVDKEVIATYLNDAMPTHVAVKGSGTRPTDGVSSAIGDRAIALPGSDGLFKDLDARISAGHPLRQLRQLANDAIAALSTDLAAYATKVRPVISPDKLVRAWLLRFFYTIPSEDLLVEELGYNSVYQWFVGLGVDEPVWTPVEFSGALDSLRRDPVFPKFERIFLTNSNVHKFLLSDQASFSMLTQYAEWCGYLPRKSADVDEANHENQTGERNLE